MGFLLLIAVPVVAEQLTEKPNVLLIISDDQGYGDFGFMGNPVLRTPRIDRLAKMDMLIPPTGRRATSPTCADANRWCGEMESVCR